MTRGWREYSLIWCLEMSNKVKNKGRLGTLVSVLCFAVIGVECGIAVIPVIVFYLSAQKYIIKGVAAGAVKG